MKTKPDKPVVKLDWSRLLGFNQSEPIADAKEAGQLNDPRLAKIGAKFGTKCGFRRVLAAH